MSTLKPPRANSFIGTANFAGDFQCLLCIRSAPSQSEVLRSGPNTQYLGVKFM